MEYDEVRQIVMVLTVNTSAGLPRITDCSEGLRRIMLVVTVNASGGLQWITMEYYRLQWSEPLTSLLDYDGLRRVTVDYN